MQSTCQTCSLYSVCSVFTSNGLLVIQKILNSIQIQNLARRNTKEGKLFGLAKFFDLTKLQDVFVFPDRVDFHFIATVGFPGSKLGLQIDIFLHEIK